jgi:hypothetical protein
MNYTPADRITQMQFPKRLKAQDKPAFGRRQEGCSAVRAASLDAGNSV